MEAWNNLFLRERKQQVTDLRLKKILSHVNCKPQDVHWNCCCIHKKYNLARVYNIEISHKEDDFLGIKLHWIGFEAK